MGSRAGYIIKRDGVATAYGAHWGASSIVDDIFWGPDHATAALSAQEKMEELADIDGGDEGSVLIDWDKKHLLWWAANWALPVQQRLLNRLMLQTWPGWTIETAEARQLEVLEYCGISLSDLLGEEEADQEEEEDVEPDEPHDSIDLGALAQPSQPETPIRDADSLQTGTWLSIRRNGGAWEDYFLVDHDAGDVLSAGPSAIAALPQQSRLPGPPPELLTTSGVAIDMDTKTVWRWKGPRYGWSERPLRRRWSDYTFHDLPFRWSSQVEATGHMATDMRAEDRDMVGWIAAQLLNDSSRNPRAILSNAVNVARGLRIGCPAATLLLAAAGGALAFALQSWLLGILVAFLCGICAMITMRIWRATGSAISLLRGTGHSDQFHPGMTVEEKRPRLSAALVAAGFPSLEELERLGEVPELRSWYDDEDEDEEEDEVDNTGSDAGEEDDEEDLDR